MCRPYFYEAPARQLGYKYRDGKIVASVQLALLPTLIRNPLIGNERSENRRAGERSPA